jgi:hypothetical protein
LNESQTYYLHRGCGRGAGSVSAEQPGGCRQDLPAEDLLRGELRPGELLPVDLLREEVPQVQVPQEPQEPQVLRVDLRSGALRACCSGSLRPGGLCSGSLRSGGLRSGGLCLLRFGELLRPGELLPEAVSPPLPPSLPQEPHLLRVVLHGLCSGWLLGLRAGWRDEGPRPRQDACSGAPGTGQEDLSRRR